MYYFHKTTKVLYKELNQELKTVSKSSNNCITSVDIQNFSIYLINDKTIRIRYLHTSQCAVYFVLEILAEMLFLVHKLLVSG